MNLFPERLKAGGETIIRGAEGANRGCTPVNLSGKRRPAGRSLESALRGHPRGKTRHVGLNSQVTGQGKTDRGIHSA
ncbi:queuine tRNA-ribosyltransferase [Desmospora sp. 8437]|nr:queuine tRNA-ribosyltransferase [Desmospora sp. 8437]